MNQALLNAFDQDIAACLSETNSTLIKIFDCYDCIPSEQRSYIKIAEHQPVHFTMFNPTAENLVFASLDNCILKSDQQSRCDFLIGNFRKLYFVEIKQVVNKGRRRTARSTAVDQLHTSISLIKSKIDLHETDLIAVICLKAKQVHPLQTAKRASDRVAFKQMHNAELMEGQSHIF